MRVRAIGVVGALAAVALATPAAALADGYMTIHGITVPVAATNEPGWMEVVSYQLNVSNPGGSSGAGAASHGKFVIVRNTDQVSPALMSAAAVGRQFQKGTLDVAGADGTELAYTLHDFVIIDYHATSGANGVPQETLTLQYTSLAMTDTSSSVESNGAVLKIPRLKTAVFKGGQVLPKTGTPAAAPVTGPKTPWR